MEDIDGQQSRGKLMLLLVNKAIRSLRDPRGSTLNDILKFLEGTYDDNRLIQDTHRLIPVLWRALNIGVNSGQLALSSDGRRFKFGPGFDPDIMVSESQSDSGQNEAKKGDSERTGRPCKRLEGTECTEMNNNKSEAAEASTAPNREKRNKRARYSGRYQDSKTTASNRATARRTSRQLRRPSRGNQGRKVRTSKRGQRSRGEEEAAAAVWRGETADARGTEVWHCDGTCDQCDEGDDGARAAYCEPILIPHVDVFT